MRHDFPQRYDTCAVQFALHYFFASEHMLRTCLDNVSRALRDGGYFYGTIASGKRVLEMLRGRDRVQSEVVSIVRTWPGAFDKYGTFGSGYRFALTATSTAADGSDGAEEYLVFFGAFTLIAAECAPSPPSPLPPTGPNPPSFRVPQVRTLSSGRS